MIQVSPANSIPGLSRIRRSLLSIALVSGCSSVVDVQSSTTSGGETSSDSTAVVPLPPDPIPSTSGVGPSTSIPEASSSSSGFDTSRGRTFGNMILDPDAGPVFIECSTAEQDCYPDQKCNAWSNDDAPVWNATKCVPLDPAANAPGEPCTVEEGPFSGIDSCAEGSLCWGVDSKTLEGTCISYCAGAGLSCVDTSTLCRVSENEVLQLCVATCDLLDPSSCGHGFACRLEDDQARCLPHAGGEIFETCADSMACGPGLRCIDAAGVGVCDPKAPGCCTPYCDLEQPMCPDTLSCFPLFDAKAQPELLVVGVCGQGAR